MLAIMVAGCLTRSACDRRMKQSVHASAGIHDSFNLGRGEVIKLWPKVNLRKVGQSSRDSVFLVLNKNSNPLLLLHSSFSERIKIDDNLGSVNLFFYS